MPIFGRKVKVEFGEAGKQGKSIEGLRVSFRVSSSIDSEPNKAEIKIYNLNEASLSLIKSPKAVIRLYAGYDTPQVIFVGNPVKDGVRAELRSEEANYVDGITEIEARDGGYAYDNARINTSYNSKISSKQQFDDIAKALGLPKAEIFLPEFQRPYGMNMYGRVRDVLDRMAFERKAAWFIRDNALYMIERGKSTKEPERLAPLVSSKTKNLIGSPREKDGKISFKALLDPGIKPGKLLKLESKDYNGVYIAQEVSYEGDSGYDNSFYVNVVAIARG